MEATAFEVQVFDQGWFVTGAQAPCEEFETTLELYVDDYVSRATLVDADGYAVTRRVVEDYFEIEEGQVTRLSVDFPNASMLPSPEADAGVIPPADAGETEPGPTEPTGEADAGADAGP